MFLLPFYFGSIVNNMEREGRGENFVNKKRLNIVARSVAAVSVAAAGAVAVEKTGLFDPLTNPVESANHLVLNNLDEAYKQLIDKLPEVEKAEANPINIETNLPTRPAGTNGTIARFAFDDFTNLVVDSFNNAPGWNCTARSNPGDTTYGDKFNCFTYCNNPVPAIGGALKIRFFNTGKDLHITDQTWGVLWPSPAGAEAGDQEGSAAGTGGSCSVGGIMEAQDLSNLPQNMDSEKSRDYTAPIAAGIGAAVAAVAATGGVLYSRRKRSA